MAMKRIIDDFKDFTVSDHETVDVPDVKNNNVELVRKAFAKQQEMAKLWDKLITTVEINGNKKYVFKEENARGYKVKDAFVLLQNYPSFAEDMNPHVVEIKIGGETYKFKIQQSDALCQILILRAESADKVRYNQFFVRGRKDLARYILEASETLINDEQLPSYWTNEYSFLKNPVARDLLNQLMVIGQVAEAAAPTEAYFDKWMEISDNTTEEIQKTVKQTWKSELQKVPELNQSENYDELFSLAKELCVPDTREQAKVKMKKLLGKQSLSDEVYKKLKTARDKVDTKVEEANKEILTRELGTREGRVPYADEVFRSTLKRIADGPIKEEWRDYFLYLFPMCKKGGTEIGRCHIIHNLIYSAT